MTKLNDIEQIIKDFIDICSYNKTIHRFYVSNGLYLTKTNDVELSIVDNIEKNNEISHTLETYKIHFF